MGPVMTPHDEETDPVNAGISAVRHLLDAIAVLRKALYAAHGLGLDGDREVWRRACEVETLAFDIRCQASNRR